MAINDFLSMLVTKLGLKKTELEKIEQEIETQEMAVYALEAELANWNDEIKMMVARIQKLKAEMDAAKTTIEQEAHKANLEIEINKLKRKKEECDSKQSKLNAANVLLHNLKLKRDHIVNPPADNETIDNSTADKEDLIKETKEMVQGISKLERTTYTRPQEDTTTSLDPLKPVSRTETRVQAEYDEIMKPAQPQGLDLTLPPAQEQEPEKRQLEEA